MNQYENMASRSRKEDPIGYATDKLSSLIDQIGEVNNNITNLKSIIKEYFSDNLQMDESPMGAMRRNQIRKEMLAFACK
jgi:hypothetical protein